MRERLPLSLNLSGELMDLSTPKVMGILNVTPDSFFADSRYQTEESIADRIMEIISDGADIIDVGGCSTRPGSQAPSLEDEWQRVESALRIIKDRFPDIPVSVDTYRSRIAELAIEKFNVQIINDVSGGSIDPEIWNVVADAHVAYVLTHTRGTPENMAGLTDYNDITADVITELSKKANELHRLGVCDVIIDPGFGFAKSVEQNFKLLSELDEIIGMGKPVLVGLSRKSMIYKTLNLTPEESFSGTVALQAIALDRGANIIRTHDVKEAVETAKLVSMMKK